MNRISEKKNLAKYPRLWIEGTVLFIITAYFFGPVVNRYYTSKRLVLLWLMFMAVLTVTSKWLIGFRDKYSSDEGLKNFWATFEMKKNDWIIMTVIFIVAMVVRNLCVEWNDPFHIYQPDEGKLVEPVIEMSKSWLSLYSDHFLYPNQFVSKIAAVVVIVLGKLAHGQVDPIKVYLIYRYIVAFFGGLCVLPAYLLGQRLYKKHGWMLAVFTALFPAFIKYSVQVTGDIPGLFFQLMVLLFSIAWFKEHRTGYAILMGLCAAISTLEKWHNGVICIYIALIVIVGCRKSLKLMIKNAVTALLSWVAGLLIFAPNILWHYESCIAQFLTIWNYPGEEKGGRWNLFVEIFFSYTGITMVIVCTLGIIYAIAKHEKDMTIIIGGLINYFVMNMIMNRLFERWACLFYFTMLTFAYIGFRYLSEIIKKPGMIISVCLFGCFSGIFLLEDVHLCVLAEAGRTKDTRFISDIVLSENGVTMDNSVYSYYTAFAPAGRRTPDLGKPIQFMSEESKPYTKNGTTITVKDDSDIKYMIISSVSNSVTYQPVDREPVFDFISGSADIFYSPNGLGGLDKFEVYTISKYVNAIKTVLESDYVGPSIRVYDISNGKWETAE